MRSPWTIAVLAVSAVAVAPQVAVALSALAPPHPPFSYRLRHGRCGREYVRQVRRVTERRNGRWPRVRQVWCVTATETTLESFQTDTNAAPGDEYFGFEGIVTVYRGTAYILTAKYLATIRDTTRASNVGSFTTGSGCWIFSTVEGDRRTFEGRKGPPPEYLSGGPEPACPLTRVSAPLGDRFGLVLSFPGNASFGPSTGREWAL